MKEKERRIEKKKEKERKEWNKPKSLVLNNTREYQLIPTLS
jgi:hypothetical protein